ncbi:adenosylcobinamide-GDP ribazoletransferase [Sphingomonas sp. 10B4]|uniref:adenosylcobinamide-GDP ribazoletransferase n=1 Tax=Sphingomonas sp. 10B4 TaxID=3048575 RepID=UPI002AB3D1B1|nr:adenosylcobinamide-GDP ribazoletransferase [Sphingomonas sp. 10B4]MDY7524393.1 adenosylcobinamide-GDP ribazoletransferase [Sphingomonas sp. 10B4]MEB0283539.1 adenosylcobinamide-GDP ribazoletransferase [Sphingomonas sp. 10B4]
MKRLIVAFGFLTRLPMPQVAADGNDFAAAIRAYPIVGLAIGGLVAASGWAGSQIDPWVGALAALVAWVAVTGALHLDGLGDLADGLGAAHGDRTRLLAVMADPHIGSFGVVTIGLQLLAKLVLLHALTGVAWWPVILVPFAARTGPLAWARWLPPLRDGLGARVATAVRPRDLIGWALVLGATAVALPAVLFTPVLILGFGLWLRWRVGGVSGDCHGAGIELVETGLLLAIVACGLR